MRFVLAAALAVLGNPANATVYISDEGREYMMSCNDSGYILTSLEPVMRISDGAKPDDTFSGEEVLYLGRTCDALNGYFGAGKWSWANAGFFVDFARKSIRFPRAELFCKGDTVLEGATMDCRQ